MGDVKEKESFLDRAINFGARLGGATLKTSGLAFISGLGYLGGAIVTLAADIVINGSKELLSIPTYMSNIMSHGVDWYSTSQYILNSIGSSLMHAKDIGGYAAGGTALLGGIALYKMSRR